MKITFDKEADAVYIKLAEGKFAKNKIIDDDIIIDLGKNEIILGIEIISASRRMPKEFFSDKSIKNLV
ncbi:MAG: DUF2283 domain-containing protein [Nanoarchaeota archaeon]